MKVTPLRRHSSAPSCAITRRSSGVMSGSGIGDRPPEKGGLCGGERSSNTPRARVMVRWVWVLAKPGITILPRAVDALGRGIARLEVGVRPDRGDLLAVDRDRGAVMHRVVVVAGDDHGVVDDGGQGFPLLIFAITGRGPLNARAMPCRRRGAARRISMG